MKAVRTDSATSNPGGTSVKVTMTTTYQRPKVDVPSVVVREGAALEGKRIRIHLDYEGHRLPYIEGGTWATPEIQEREEYLDQFGERAPEIVAAIRRGEPIYDLWLDNRFGLSVCESELERWTPFLAHAMAVAAGYTSHGSNSRPINRHGPSRI